MYDSIVCKDTEEVFSAYDKAFTKINTLWRTYSSEKDECLIFNYGHSSLIDANPKKVSEEQAIAILNHIAEVGVLPL